MYKKMVNGIKYGVMVAGLSFLAGCFSGPSKYELEKQNLKNQISTLRSEKQVIEVKYDALAKTNSELEERLKKGDIIILFNGGLTFKVSAEGREDFYKGMKIYKEGLVAKKQKDPNVKLYEETTDIERAEFFFEQIDTDKDENFDKKECSDFLKAQKEALKE